jgi:hypothetical protein
VSKKRRRKSKAWLVTWEWASDSAKRDDKVAAVFSPHLGAKRVGDFIEFLYMTECSSLSEQMDYALRKVQNPYPARLGTTPEGNPWAGDITCGHHPFLFARLVDELAIERNTEGREVATWTERPKPWELRIGIWSDTTSE